jgi:hypothetical protein
MCVRSRHPKSNHPVPENPQFEILVLDFYVKIGKAVGILLPNEFTTTHLFKVMYLFCSFEGHSGYLLSLIAQRHDS